MATQVVQEQVRPTRRQVDSLARWQAALQRALANGLEVFTVADTGERMVTSASRLDTLYRTDGRRCSCEAALSGDPICQHRAVVRFVLGWLPSATSVDCPNCSGCGVVHYRSGNQERCSECGGSGVKPDHRPSGAPAVTIAA